MLFRSGRDVLSRMLYGARLALVVALVAGTLTCLIGATLGLIAGYYRGWADIIISRIVDIWMGRAAGRERRELCCGQVI